MNIGLLLYETRNGEVHKYTTFIMLTFGAAPPPIIAYNCATILPPPPLLAVEALAPAEDPPPPPEGASATPPATARPDFSTVTAFLRFTSL